MPAGPVRDRAPTPPIPAPEQHLVTLDKTPTRSGHPQQQRPSATEATSTPKSSPFPQDPTARLDRPHPNHSVPTGKPAVLEAPRTQTAYWSVFHP